MTPALEHSVVEALPGGHRRKLLAVGIDLIPVVLAATSVHVYIYGSQPALSFPCETTGPKQQNNGKSKVRVEEALGVTNALADRGNSNVELGV